MRYAAIDIGTNSCRLLVAEIKEGKLRPLCRNIQTTRLGEGLDASGRISPGAVRRTIDCLQNFQSVINNYKVVSHKAVATSAIREASNREEVLTLVAKGSNIAIDVISGQEEACLSYLGVEKGLGFDRPPLVVDLGGGSTELILEGGSRLLMSVPLGAVKATESNMSDAEIKSAFSALFAEKDKFAENPLVFVGGTATSLVAIKESMTEYRPELVHGQVLTRKEIVDIYNMLGKMSLSLRRELPGLQPDRADIIVKGVLILLQIVDALGKNKITVSESDLLEGIIWKLNEDDRRRKGQILVKNK